jgi:hypothetical protein
LVVTNIAAGITPFATRIRHGFVLPADAIRTVEGRTRIDRFRNLAAFPGNPVQRTARVMLYILWRGASRLPCYEVLLSALRRLAPGFWSRLQQRQQAYRSLAEWRTIPPDRKH